ncbi:MAG TPA: ABC transporter permease [Conexibacter sp.]
MLPYLLRRLAQSLVVLFGLAVVTFLIIHLVPGDPVQQMLGARATPHTVATVRLQLGLDRPLLAQFGSFVGDTVTGRFGDSITQSAPVGQLIGQRIAPSALLIAYGMLIALVIGVPLAIVAALRPNGFADNLIRVATTFSFAMPTFWLGLMLALLLGLELHVFPVSGYSGGIGGVLRTLTLPALTLGLSLSAIVVRTLRSSLLEVLQTEYIDAARARGLSERRVIGKHAMRNAVMGTITVLSVNLGFLIGGTVVIESVFQIPGLGSLLVQSVEHRDYQLVQTLALLAGATVVLVSLATDFLQAAIDPRIRLASA